MIDVHAHAFPDFLAERAMTSLAADSGDYTPCTDGTLAGLASSMDASGVELSWIANIATKPAQAGSILEWSRSVSSERFVFLGSVHPESPVFEEEIYAFREAGFAGLKLHPLYQRFNVDDLSLAPFFRAIQESGMFVLLHSGYDIAFAGADNAHPRRMRKLIDRFPDLDIIAAHLGGWLAWEDALEQLAGSPCYFDTSFIDEADPAVRDAIIERCGAERILFGSDSPWKDQRKQIEAVRSIGLSAAQESLVFSGNARALMQKHSRATR